MKSRHFTVADAFNIQAKNIALWSKVLTPDAYIKLLDKVLRKNAEVINEKGSNLDPYDIPRGQDIDSMVYNIALSID